mgnify:FL=1
MNKTPSMEPFFRRILPRLGEVFGSVGYIALGPSLRARVELANDSNCGGLYNGFRVEVIHRQNGRIDSVFIPWADALGAKRKDTRPDWVGPFEVKANVSSDWYIAVPADEKPLAAALDRYLKIWS